MPKKLNMDAKTAFTANAKQHKWWQLLAFFFIGLVIMVPMFVFSTLLGIVTLPIRLIRRQL